MTRPSAWVAGSVLDSMASLFGAVFEAEGAEQRLPGALSGWLLLPKMSGPSGAGGGGRGRAGAGGGRGGRGRAGAGGGGLGFIQGAEVRVSEVTCQKGQPSVGLAHTSYAWGPSRLPSANKTRHLTSHPSAEVRL